MSGMRTRFAPTQDAAKELLQRGAATSGMKFLRPILADNVAPEAMLAANATLRKYEWEQIDARVNAVIRERLTIVDDLRANGLVTPVNLGSVLRTTERLEQFGAAQVSFDGDTAPEKDRPSFIPESIPVPVISKDFQLNWRQLEASRQKTEPLDLSSAASATRRVRDQLQDLIVNGLSYGPGGNIIPGLLTAVNRQKVSLHTDWNVSGSTIIDDVQRMLAAAYAVFLFGPFYLYVPKNYWAIIQEDYKAFTSTTYLQRIEAFEDIESVRPLDALPSDNVVMVQMTQDVLDLSEAQAITTVQWQKNPLVTNFRVLTVAGPQIKTIENQNGTSVHGIIHLS